MAEGQASFVWAKAALPESTKPSAQDKSYRDGFAADTVALLDPWIAPSAKAVTVNGVAIPARAPWPSASD